MRIAINTSGTIMGGAITHLRNVIPRMLEYAPNDDFVVIANDETAAQIGIAQSDRIERVAPNVVFAKQWRRALWENTALPGLLRDRAVDVVFHPTNIPLYRCSVPQVNLVHNMAPFLPAIVAEESAHQKLRLSVLRSLTTSAFRFANRTIFVSEWGKRRVMEVARPARDPGPVIHFGADHARPPLASNALSRWGLEAGRYVLSVSHFYRYKRIEHLVNAYSELGTQVTGYPLVLVGSHFDEPYTAEVRRLASTSAERVIFTGSVDAESVHALLAGCAVFVFTSEAENLPVALLESMQEGAPIVTNRECSMPEICGDAALYVDSLDAKAYARALGALLENEELRRDYAKRSRERANRFRWSDAAAATLALLREVAGAQNGRKASLLRM